MISFGRCSAASSVDRVVVEPLVLRAHAVVHRLEPLARHVRLGAVGQVPAGGEVHREERVARLHQRQEHRLVRLAPECGWTLAKPAPNSLQARSIASRLGDVDELAAAVVAPARVALGVLVGHHRALRLEHGAADDVLGGDQLDLVALADQLVGDRAGRSRGRSRRAARRRSRGRAGRLSRAEPPADADRRQIARTGRAGNPELPAGGTGLEFAQGAGESVAATRAAETPWRSSGSISWPVRSRSPRRPASG